MKCVRFVQIAVSPVVDDGDAILPDLYGLTAQGQVYEYSELQRGWKPLPMREAEPDKAPEDVDA